ncbi:MAG: glycine cleavage system aminomethyltransferase GcvT, partial [Gemmatimonadota bacterium]
LYDEHVRLNAKIVPFGGFAMPVQYPDGIQAEHRAVRSSVGVFDLSHMGEFRARGPEAGELVSYLCTNDPSGLDVGQAQYTAMCYEDGGIVDDLVVYRLGEGDYRMVVNAANVEKDWVHVVAHAEDFDAELEDESDDVALIAVQGPDAEPALEPLVDVELEPIGFYRSAEGTAAGADAVISRTGYTGEDGFELYVDAGDAPGVWRALLESDAGPTPAGLGARDTLRLEMGYALYGHEIDEDTTPLEARLGWLVKMEKGDFVGRDALARQEERGLTRRLQGFRLTERGFPREGYDVVYGGEEVGEVRSGTVSPSLGYGIGTAYFPTDAGAGDGMAVRIRDREVEGEIVKLPFYTEGSLKR